MTDHARPGGLTCAEADELAPAFVLGALEPDEAAAARAHLADCPEAHLAFAEAGGTAAYLAELPEPLEPPAAVRDRLMTAVADDLATRSRVAVEPVAAEPVAAETVAAEPVSLGAERERRRPVLRWVLAAAAVIAIVALLGSNLLLQTRADQAETLARQLRDAVSTAGQPGAEVATVAGTEAQPAAAGFVVMADGAGYLVVDGLADLGPDQIYEAWTIGADGVPAPAGLARPHDGLVVFEMAAQEPVAVVALTIEPAAGSTTPTLPIQAAGELGG